MTTKSPDRLADWPSHWRPKQVYITLEQAEKMKNQAPACPFCEAGIPRRPAAAPPSGKGVQR